MQLSILRCYRECRSPGSSEPTAAKSSARGQPHGGAGRDLIQPPPHPWLPGPHGGGQTPLMSLSFLLTDATEPIFDCKGVVLTILSTLMDQYLDDCLETGACPTANETWMLHCEISIIQRPYAYNCCFPKVYFHGKAKIITEYHPRILVSHDSAWFPQGFASSVGVVSFAYDEHSSEWKFWSIRLFFWSFPF